MANPANGYVSVKSGHGGLLQMLQKLAEQHSAFSYDGAPDCNIDGNELSISFSGPWNCRAAWEVFDGLLAYKNISLQQALIDSEITGHDEESSSDLFTWVRKLPGETEITYSYPLEDLNINSVWDAFKLLVPHLPKVGTSIEVGHLENLSVTSKRTKMTIKHGSCLHYNLSCDRDGISHKFSFYVTAVGDVIGTKYWSDCMDDDEGINYICNENDFIYAIVHGHMARTL